MAARWRRDANPFANSVFVDNRPPPAYIARRLVPPPLTKPGSSAFLDATSGFGKRTICSPTQEGLSTRLSTKEGFWQPRATTASAASGSMPRMGRPSSRPPLSSSGAPEVTTSGRVLPWFTAAECAEKGLRVGISPEVLNVHHEKHIGGAANIVAAGVRTAQNGVSIVPWTKQVGKPNGHPVGVYGCFL